MLDPTTLFEYESFVDPRTVHAHTLIVTLGAYVDAGHAQHVLSEHLLNSLASHRLGSFDVDQLTTYLEARPQILYASDEFSNYQRPRMELHQVTDVQGQEFLLLTGPEPGLQWERLAACIAAIVDRHDVQLTIVAQGMPMPVPHTRPVVVSRWANKHELVAHQTSMFGTMLLQSSFPSMMAQRLGESGHDVLGLTAHVPHYLVESDYPDAAIALIGAIAKDTDLDLPTIQLAVAAGVVRAQIGAQIEADEELSEHVAQLEEQYDEFTHQREVAAAAEDLPSADEIGHEAEEFLRTLDRPDAAPDAADGSHPANHDPAESSPSTDGSEGSDPASDHPGGEDPTPSNNDPDHPDAPPAA